MMLNAPKRDRKPVLTSEQAARCRAIVNIVAHDTGVPSGAFFSPSRCGLPTAKARQLAMYLCHVLAGLTMTQVGLFFRRDRTTVAHACALIEDARDDQNVERRIQALEDRIARSRLPRRARHNSASEGLDHVW